MLFSLAQKPDGNTGKYDTTYWPIPLVITRDYWLKYDQVSYNENRADGTTYSRLNFKDDKNLRIELYDLNMKSGTEIEFQIGTGNGLKEVMTNMKKENNWQQQEIPEKIFSSSIIGVQGGTETVKGIYEDLTNKGVDISGIWIQDWSGSVTTDFGQRVFWNWKWNEERYPGLDKVIQEYKKDGTIFLVYMNMHLNTLGDLSELARKTKGVLVERGGEIFEQEFGGFQCVTIDLTTDIGRSWYKENIIFPALSLGIRGWMADFGE